MKTITKKANLICHSFEHHLINPFWVYVIIVKNVVNHHDERFSLQQLYFKQKRSFQLENVLRKSKTMAQVCSVVYFMFNNITFDVI